MKAIPRILLVPLFLAACGAAEQKEKEPNNTLAGATPVRAGVPVTGDLSSPEDRDWLRVSLPAGRLLSFILEHDPRADLAVEVQSAGRLIALADGLAAATAGARAGRKAAASPGAPAREHASFLDGRGEDIIIMIRAASAEGAYPVAWRLSTETGTADGTEREPNNAPDEAVTISGKLAIQGRYSPGAGADGAERDFYRYVNNTTNRITLEIEVSGVPDVDSVIEIYGEGGSVSRTIDGQGIHYGESSGPLGLGPSMSCVFALRGKAPGQGNPRVSYSVRARTREASPDDEFEPNESAEEANQLIAGEAVRGRVFPEGERDYFRLPLPAPGRYTISARLAPEGDADLVLELLDANERVLLTSDYEAAGRPEYIANYGCTAHTEGVSLYLRVSAKPGARDPAYSVMANFHPAGAFAEFEPNDTRGAANPLALGVETRGYFFPPGDQDWLCFDLDEECSLDIRLLAPSGLRAGVRLLDAAGQAVAETASFAAGEVRLRAPRAPRAALDPSAEQPALLQPGRYFLALSAEDAGNPRDPWVLRASREEEE